MLRLSALVLVSLLCVGCGSDAETEEAARADARARTRAVPADPAQALADAVDEGVEAERDVDPVEVEFPDEPVNLTCREGIGPAVAEAEGAGVLRLVSEHTVDARTRSMGDGCLVVLSRDWTAAQLRPGEPFPYNYSYFLTNASGGRVQELPLDLEPPAAGLAAVALQDLNGDGEIDILAVHDGGPALAWISTEAGRWSQDIPSPNVAGVNAQTIAAAREIYRDLYADPVSP